VDTPADQRIRRPAAATTTRGTPVNIEAWIQNQVNSGKEAEISLALLERQMYEPAIKNWIKSTAKKLDCTAVVHWASDVVTFYPRSVV
jgi:hypothetical protein